MDENFWDKIKRLLNAMDKPDIWLIKNAGLGKTAIINGQTKKTRPSVDIAYRCARVLKTTVEELIDGEAGEQYLREYVREKRWAFSPPERIADIVEAADKLSDEQLDYVMGLIKTMLDKKEGSGIPPEVKSGRSHPKTG
jgi:DNA-binding XRE family transcriptional regulator